MTYKNLHNGYIQSYMLELSSRVVAESGIPTDRYHFGKLVFQGLHDDPNFVLQIDGGTGESETSGSVLERSVRCALSLRQMGLKTGDVMVLMAPSHLDLAIAFYAGLFQGLIVGAEDKNLNSQELQRSFQISKPKIVFCQADKADDVREAINNINVDTRIVTFDKHNDTSNLNDLLDTEYDKDFRPVDIDTENSIGFLLVTSGTTGVPKMVAHTHKSYYNVIMSFWQRGMKFPTPTKLMAVFSPIHWMTGFNQFLSCPLLRFTSLQISKPLTRDRIYDIINTYKPTLMASSPTLLYLLLSPENIHRCNFSCLEMLWVGGSAITKKLMQHVQDVMPNTSIMTAYGMSECGVIFTNISPISCGQVTIGEIKLVHPDTREEINEINVAGELLVRGPGVLKEYYNNLEETASALSKDGWYKTGDLFYRDENWNFYFVDRIKMMIKYRLFQISPVEIENVIRSHENVVDAAVTGYPDEECGELPTAFVVLRDSHATTAQDIKDLVNDSLSDVKRLRGGVIFVESLPMTPTTKIDRKKLKQMVLNIPNLYNTRNI